jgi:hypothetical protein
MRVPRVYLLAFFPLLCVASRAQSQFDRDFWIPKTKDAKILYCSPSHVSDSCRLRAPSPIGETRGSVCKLSPLDDAMVVSQRKALDVVALDDALKELARIDTRQSRVVELCFFGGLTLEEISAALDLGTATVQFDWTSARAWFYHEISGKSRG